MSKLHVSYTYATAKISEEEALKNMLNVLFDEGILKFKPEEVNINPSFIDGAGNEKHDTYMVFDDGKGEK